MPRDAPLLVPHDIAPDTTDDEAAPARLTHTVLAPFTLDLAPAEDLAWLGGGPAGGTGRRLGPVGGGPTGKPAAAAAAAAAAAGRGMGGGTPLPLLPPALVLL